MSDYLPRTGKAMVLKFKEMEKLQMVAHALSNEQRLRILYELGSHSLNINELRARWICRCRALLRMSIFWKKPD